MVVYSYISPHTISANMEGFSTNESLKFYFYSTFHTGELKMTDSKSDFKTIKYFYKGE